MHGGGATFFFAAPAVGPGIAAGGAVPATAGTTLHAFGPHPPRGFQRRLPARRRLPWRRGAPEYKHRGSHNLVKESTPKGRLYGRPSQSANDKIIVLFQDSPFQFQSCSYSPAARSCVDVHR